MLHRFRRKRRLKYEWSKTGNRLPAHRHATRLVDWTAATSAPCYQTDSTFDGPTGSVGEFCCEVRRYLVLTDKTAALSATGARTSGPACQLPTRPDPVPGP